MKRNPSLLSSQSFDLLVCGGGIYGAWAAYDAALRGLKVALIEQGDWGNATSSASSKLIHGGLRYLEHFDFKLVRKALAERQMLMHSAPYRVWPLRFGIPVYPKSRVGLLRLKLGLMLYDFFANDIQTNMKHRFFNRQHFSERFPLLSSKTLKCGLTYADAQTDDARLVLELIAGALDAGAVCVNYCKQTRLSEKNGLATGATILDLLTHQEREIHARQIVFTTGQWLTEVNEIHNNCQLTKGIHLIMPAALKEEALLLTAKSDGRVFFVIPWYGLTLLGTTDTPYQGSLEQINITKSEIAYLLNAVNDYLEEPWSENDIIASFAGLRVLKQASPTSATAPSSLSRDWELKTMRKGVHYSIGGKLTSAREDAARIVDKVCMELEIPAPCVTENHLFPWHPFNANGQNTATNFSDWSQTMQTQAIQLGVDPEAALWLVRRHGRNTLELLRCLEKQPALARRIISTVPIIYADLIHCATNEMVVHLDDLLRRRLPLLILARLTDSKLHEITHHIADIVNWDETRCQQEIIRCHQPVAVS